MKFELKDKVYLTDKVIEISGPCQLSIQIDYDDVNKKIVDNAVDRLITILNNNWTEEDTEDCNAARTYQL